MTQETVEYDGRKEFRISEDTMRILRFVAACVAAAVFFVAGVQMREITSVSGDSIDEAFYHALGLFSWGMAVLSLTLGITTGAVSIVGPPTETTNAVPHSDVE
jgi:hypothetical protein